jgi:outer membrane protein TolC
MKKFLLLSALQTLLFSGLFAQQTSLKIATLQDAWNYALKNNPDQNSYQLMIEKAKVDYHTSLSLLLPVVSGNFNGQINTKLATTAVPGEIAGKPGQTMNVQFGQKYNYSTGISLSKSLFDMQNNYQIQLTKNTVKTSQLQADAYKQSLKEQVAMYYYTAIISQEALHLYQQNLGLADSTIMLTNQKVQQGLLNSVTANQAYIARNTVQQQIFNTESTRAHCENALKILLGLDENTSLVFDTITVKNQLFAIVDQTLGKDNVLAVQENQLKNAELKVTIQKTAFLPKLNWYSYWGEQQFRNDFAMTFNSGDWHPVSYVGLNVQVPLFTGFANINKFKSSKIELQKSQSDWEESKRKATMNDKLLVFESNQSKQMLNPAKDTYERFLQNQQTANQQLKEGIISLDAYNKIFEDYLNAENAYLNALSVYYSYYSTIISRQ